MSKIYTAPVYKIIELNNIFIELTAKNCNHKCQICHIKFDNNILSNKIFKDFIPIDKIKEALNDTKNENIHCIYLTGAEPMMHPDFNSILRLCLKRCNVCICTNGSYLNEKKIRFLNKVESEGKNEIFFRLSLAHFDENENDSVKYRGNFRQTIFALKTLSRYNFRSVLSVQNYYKINKEILMDNFRQLFNNSEIYNSDIQINCSYPEFENENYTKPSAKTDCMYGRMLTKEGIYSCPFLSGDYRGRVGTNFKNFSNTINAETDFCATCSKNNDFIFTIG